MCFDLFLEEFANLFCPGYETLFEPNSPPTHAELASLEADLAELERTDPVVREAKRKYDEACAAILASPDPRAAACRTGRESGMQDTPPPRGPHLRAFDTGALPAFVLEDDEQ